MLANLQETHDAVLKAYQAHRTDELTREEFEDHVAESGFIPAVNEMFLAALRTDDTLASQKSIKFHPTMLQYLLRYLDSPRIVETPHVKDPFPDEFETLGLRLDALRHLKGEADRTPELVGFAGELLENQRISFPSPFSNEMLVFTSGFASYFRGKPYLFYIAQTCEPLIAIANPNMGNIIAFYFPERHLVIGQPLAYDAIVAHLKVRVLRNIAAVCAYLANSGPRVPTLITGFMQHAGHTILNELTGLDLALKTHKRTSKMPLCIGPHEYVETVDLFPEFANSDIFRINPSETDLFAHGLANNILPVRPTMRYYLISKSFRSRMARVAGQEVQAAGRLSFERLRKKFTARFNKNARVGQSIDLSTVSHNAPIVWVEIRSNHRIWVNQVTGIKTLIDNLKKSHPKAALFIAGWSRPHALTQEDTEQIDADMKVFREIAEYGRGSLPVICGVGLSSREKLQWAYACHCCITSFGSGMTVPCLIANLPSVVHSNKVYTKRPAMDQDPNTRIVFAEDLYPYEVVAAEHITDVADTPRYQVRSHEVSGAVIYDYLLKVIPSNLN